MKIDGKCKINIKTVVTSGQSREDGMGEGCIGTRIYMVGIDTGVPCVSKVLPMIIIIVRVTLISVKNGSVSLLI